MSKMLIDGLYMVIVGRVGLQPEEARVTGRILPARRRVIERGHVTRRHNDLQIWFLVKYPDFHLKNSYP